MQIIKVSLCYQAELQTRAEIFTHDMFCFAISSHDRLSARIAIHPSRKPPFSTVQLRLQNLISFGFQLSTVCTGVTSQTSLKYVPTARALLVQEDPYPK